ncbi:MAG: hypothetical protein JXR53_00740 [Bacteroidales bacterium]|nr:hypothetical protein [Bacteroidales bacterium]
MKNIDRRKLTGIALILFGVFYIVYDCIHYYTHIGVYEGLLLIPLENKSMLSRIPMIIYMAFMIIGAVYYIHDKKDSWYFLKIAFLGMIADYLVFNAVMFIGFASLLVGNPVYNIHFVLIFAIWGLIYFSKKRIGISFDNNSESFFHRPLSFFLLGLFTTLFFYFEYFIPPEKYPKFSKEAIYDAYPMNQSEKDTCFYTYDFLWLLSSPAHVSLFDSFEMAQTDSTGKVIYSEKFSSKYIRILSSYYYDNGSLVKEIAEQFDGDIDTNTYTYFKNGFIKTMMRISGNEYSLDTTTYKFILREEPSVLTPFNNNDTNNSADTVVYDYVMLYNIDTTGRVIEATQINADKNPATISYSYDEKGKIVSISYKSFKENEIEKTEYYYYDAEGNLKYKVTYEDSDDFWGPILTFTVYVNYKFSPEDYNWETFSQTDYFRRKSY